MSTISFSKNVYLLETLQVNLDETATREGIYVVRSIFNVAKEAILALGQGKLNHFDPLCSDQACQIRAIIIAMLAKVILENKDPLNKLENALKDNMAKLQKRFKDMNLPGFKLEGSLRDNVLDCDILLPETLGYFVQCALLTVTKQKHIKKALCLCHSSVVETYKEKSQPTNARISVSSKTIRYSKIDEALLDIVEKTKIKVAEVSCKYLISQLEGQVIANKKVLKEVNGRVELPCILSIGGALMLAAKNKIPLLIKSIKASHLLELKQKESTDVQLLYSIELGKDRLQAKLMPSTEIKETQPLFVIEGQRYVKDESTQDYTTRLMDADIIDVILLNAARHSQYSKVERDKELVIEEDSEIKKLVSDLTNLTIEADKKGCSIVNQNLFRILHIYCSTIKGEK